MWPYIKSFTNLAGHPKFKRLCKLLDISPVLAMGYLHFLWQWCAVYAANGTLDGHNIEDIAMGSEWHGDPHAWINALIEAGGQGRSGFLERDQNGGLLLHNWDRYYANMEAYRENNRRRQQEWRDRKKHNTTGVMRNVTGVTDRYDNAQHNEITRETELNRTEHNVTEGDLRNYLVTYTEGEAANQGETRNGPPERDGRDDLGETESTRISQVVSTVITGIEQAHGQPYTGWNTQRVMIIKLINAGYTGAEIVGTWSALWEQDKSRFPPLDWVADRIGAYRNNGGKLPEKKEVNSGVHKNYPGPPSDADPREYYRSSYELLERRERIRQQEEQQQAEKKGTTTGDS